MVLTPTLGIPRPSDRKMLKTKEKSRRLFLPLLGVCIGFCIYIIYIYI